MDVTTYTDARKNLKSLMDRIVADSTHAVITRRNGEPVVMLSLAEWNSIQETDYLMSSSENAARLRESIAELDAGKGRERELAKS